LKVHRPDLQSPVRRPRSSWAGIALGCGLFLFPLSLFALDPAKSIFQFNVQNWSRQTGLPTDKVNSVTQTKDGYLWLGTQVGLVRFNGREFQVVPIDLPQARGVEVTKSSRAPDGRLWFVVVDGGFGGFDGEKFSAIGDRRWNAPDIISVCLLAARDGSIWTGSVSGWGRWMAGKPQETFSDESFGTVISLWEDAAGRVWLGTAEHGLFYWENGGLKLFPDEELKRFNIYSIVQDRAGDLWVATNGGLFHYDAAFRRKGNSFPELQTNVLFVDRQGVLWAGTKGTGLGRFQDGKFTLLRKADGLGSDMVTSLFEDAEGSLWVGTLEGLSQLSDLKFPIYSTQEGLPPGSAIAVSASDRGGLWIGLASGASYLDGHGATNYSDPSYLPNGYVRRIFEARNGDVYLADGNKNINIVSAGRLVARCTNGQWPEAFVEDATGVIGAIGPDLFRLREGRLEPYRFDGAAPAFAWFNTLCLAKDGAIWAATNNGLFRIEDGRGKQWTMAEGLSSNRVNFVFEDIDGSIWCGLPTGLVRLKHNAFSNVTSTDGLADPRIYAIVPDDLGFFWLNSGRGILRVSRRSLNEFADDRSRRVACDIFDGTESVKSTDRTDQGFSGCKTLDGRIWFPSPAGVVMVDPAHYFTNLLPPRVHIERVRTKGRALPQGRLATFQVGERSVEFSFSALSFIAPAKVSVRYQLEGFDATWVDAGLNRSVTYNNLHSGRYTFRVQAANADGVWNTVGDQFSLELPPPYYERPWFYALCGGALALAVFGGYRWKLRQLRSRQQKLQAENDLLETKVTRRTDQLANSVSLLKATLDSTADGIISFQLSSRSISYNQQFAEMWRIPLASVDRADEAELRIFAASQVKDPAKFAVLTERILAEPDRELFDVIELKDDRTFECYSKPQHIAGKTVGVVVNFRDITRRKQAEAQLAETHRQLVDASRQAGMAEVATGVLHNVGNVLNSVNVSATLVVEQVRHSNLANVSKLAALFGEHEADLPVFLTQDPRGRMIPGLLAMLKDSLAEEQAALLKELDHLRKKIEHIKDIVSIQQSYGRSAGVIETVALADLAEEALRIDAGSLLRHDVELVRDFQIRPMISTDRYKIIQILINLLRNATHACDESGRRDKRITIRIAADARRVHIAVSDNGVGIPVENLVRIFNHGFTTRKDGHGFGLHSSALATKELGGSLTVHSDGPGLGATFTLELPLGPVLPP